MFPLSDMLMISHSTSNCVIYLISGGALEFSKEVYVVIPVSLQVNSRIESTDNTGSLSSHKEST